MTLTDAMADRDPAVVKRVFDANFGVYGVPETFVVAGDGTIAYKFVGPLTPAAVTTTLLPAIQRAAQKAAPAATTTNTP